MNSYLEAQPTLVLATEDPITGEPIKAGKAKAKVEPKAEPEAETGGYPEETKP